MIEDASILKEAVKGQTIKDLSVSQDRDIIKITFESGGTLTVSGQLMDAMSVSGTLYMELVE